MARGYLPAFAVIRIERDLIRAPESDDEFEVLCDGWINVVRVLWSRDRALAEAERLNSLNNDEGSFYYVQHTRVQESAGQRE